MLPHRSEPQLRARADAAVPGSSFVGSFLDEPDRPLIVLRGDIDAPTVQRLGAHIDSLLAAGARFLDIDAAAVDSYDPPLLHMLGETQSRLGRRRGMLRVHGLHPHLIPG